MPKLVEGIAAKMRVPEGRRDVVVFDDACPGFGIRKFASGKAYYFVKFTAGTTQRKLSLGRVVPGTLSEKRRRASEILTRARAGQDVVAEKQIAKVKQTITLGELVPLYLNARESELRASSYMDAVRHLERYWLPLHKVAVEAIERRQVVRVLDDIADEHGKVAADRARTALGTFFAWAIDRGYLDNTPVHHIQRRAPIAKRDRVLTEAELVEVWEACQDDDYGKIVRLIIMTGQRRAEIGDLQKAELDRTKRVIELPPERTKNALSHLVPLSDAALEILTDVHDREGREHLFGDGSRGFQGWSKAKAALDERILSTRLEADPKAKPMPPWILHDIRRSVVTHLHELGFAPPHVVEAIVNHVSGHRAGVAGVYNKALYLSERRRALDLWGSHVTNLVDGPESSVVQLRAVSRG